MNRIAMHRSMVALLVSTSIGLAACSSTTASDGAPTADSPDLSVAANFYPVEWLVKEIGGDAISVTGLTPLGEEPHDLILNAQTREVIESSNVVFYLGSGFQPDVEKALAQRSQGPDAVDLLKAPGVVLLDAPADLGKESLAGNKDPHVWLDPILMQAMAKEIAAVLSKAAPSQSGEFEKNRDALLASLGALDDELQGAIRGCLTNTIVTSHAAFSYLAQRYGLIQLAITGISPDDQPDPATLQQIAADAKAAGVTTVFFEEQLPRELSETVAMEIGARIDLLSALEFDPEEFIGPGQSYLTVMSDNGKRIAAGLQCA